MARLGEAGLLAHAQTNGAPQRLWFATPAGARAAREAGALQDQPRLFTAAEVAGPLQAHGAVLPTDASNQATGAGVLATGFHYKIERTRVLEHQTLMFISVAD